MILLTLIVVLLVVALPVWPYARAWGYYPSGGCALLLAYVIALFCCHRL